MHFFQQQQSTTEGSYHSYHQPVHSHHPWHSAYLYRSYSRAKVAMEKRATKFVKLQMLQRVFNLMCGSISPFYYRTCEISILSHPCLRMYNLRKGFRVGVLSRIFPTCPVDLPRPCPRPRPALFSSSVVGHRCWWISSTAWFTNCAEQKGHVAGSLSVMKQSQFFRLHRPTG